MSDPLAVPVVPVPHDPEAGQPGWQTWLNQFCENWIFAFIVAMAIRHFCIEAFVIPTASMEPMLYGDPGFMKGDHVVVDKLFSRFTGVQRWGVTVFQFPIPEIESTRGSDVRPAVDANGERLDHPLIRPLMCRNFVKRAVILPGDVFYINSGNIYLKRDDGSFAAATKPDAIQEAVYDDIWLSGGQSGYLPWTGESGATVSAPAGSLSYQGSAEGRATFTQPMRNLYLKPARVRVAEAANSKDGEIVSASMTAPIFNFRGKEGNLWDLDRWSITRLTSKDLDASHGTELNPLMDEWVGDVRFHATMANLEGSIRLVWKQGAAHTYSCVLDNQGWSVTGDGKELGAGQVSLLGRDIAFGILDDQVVLRMDGKPVMIHEIPACDASRDRLRVAIEGSGKATFTAARMQRDVHYSSRGFLSDELGTKRLYEGNAAYARSKGDDELYDTSMRNLGLLRTVRESLRPGPLSATQAVAKWGYSPETAITAPANAYLLMGDNSPHSWDGRMWGWVPADNIRGRALAVFLPWNRWKIIR